MKSKILVKEEHLTFSYNKTEQSKTSTYFPKSEDEVKYLLKNDLKKKKFLVRTGLCGHGDKACLNTSPYSISLIKLNKVLKLNNNKKNITVQSGILLVELVKFLKEKNLFIYNIPGGRNVSLGGAISGNVHGRFAVKKFANFGDNVISLKILKPDGRIIKVNRKNNLFYKIIGGQSLFGIILEAKLLIHKIEAHSYSEELFYIKNKKEFTDFQKKNEKFFGIVDIFNQKDFSVNLKTIKPIRSKLKNNKKKASISKDVKLPNIFSLLVNNLSLKILYFYFFNLREKLSFGRKKVISFESSVYVSNYIYTIPSFFKKGFLEMQFSVSEKKLFNLVNDLKNLFKRENRFPVFLIIKKMPSSQKKYFFNFPTYEFSLSLGFSKKIYLENRAMFKVIYKLLDKNNCNMYVAKDELFLDNLNKNLLKKKYLNNFKINNKSSISSNFNEKILKVLK
tara:strand:+ start:591 stop:1940 length:1350 start_codon:yes stop_codon:yes gene_type:complete